MATIDISKRDAWCDLKEFTPARIAMGRAGGSVRTNDWLSFKLDHARARDAVHGDFDSHALTASLTAQGKGVLSLKTKVVDRTEYLRRPDLGRHLDDDSRDVLMRPAKPFDLVFIISDGLSAEAVNHHVKALLSVLVPKFRHDAWHLAPFVIVPFSRVAVEDEIGELLGATLAVMLIGERPGLGAPDSLGAYIVHQPKTGNTDANRNCVSNIRPQGLTYERAADTIFYLLNEARQRQVSGVMLKDDRATDVNQLPVL